MERFVFQEEVKKISESLAVLEIRASRRLTKLEEDQELFVDFL